MILCRIRETGHIYRETRIQFITFVIYDMMFILCCDVTEQEVCEAFAQYDFKGRTDRELSFKKGDTLVVFQRKSDDWWEGALRGKEGLIPDKYIIIKKIITK